jgi:hypothetical protein
MSKEAIVLKCDAGGRVLVPLARQVELVREFERSGLSGPKFAALAGIKYQTFVVWRRKHGRVPAVRSSSRRRPIGLWLEAEVARTENPTVGLSVDLGGAAVLKIADGSQVALAAQLIRALRLPC